MLSREARQAWEQDGWALLHNVIPSDVVDAARNSAETLLAPDVVDFRDGNENDQWRVLDPVWPSFPYESSTLNTLALHPRVLDLASELMCADNIRLYLSLITIKRAGNSSGGTQTLHVDYPGHTILVPSNDELPSAVQFFVYLDDVSEANGATRLVSRGLTRNVPVNSYSLSNDEYALLYKASRPAVGPAGSVLAYGLDVYHHSVDSGDYCIPRLLMHLAYRRAKPEAGSYQTWPFKASSVAWENFVERATPRQLVAVGFPIPGDPYWTKEHIAQVGARYPQLDLSSWICPQSPDDE